MNTTMIARIRWQAIMVNCLFQRSTSAPTIGASSVGSSVTTPILLTSTPVVAAAAAAATSAMRAMLCRRSPSCATVCPMTSSVNLGRARTDAMLPGAGLATCADASGGFTRDPVGLEDEPLVRITANHLAHPIYHTFHETVPLRLAAPLGNQRRVERHHVSRAFSAVRRGERGHERRAGALRKDGRPHGNRPDSPRER